jgi:hypothetical protein
MIKRADQPRNPIEVLINHYPILLPDFRFAVRSSFWKGPLPFSRFNRICLIILSIPAKMKVSVVLALVGVAYAGA